MTSDLDIYRSAQALVKQHGEDAPIEAAMRADAMLEKGNLDGCAVYPLRRCQELIHNDMVVSATGTTG